MIYMTREERLLQLEKMTNTRDLGGYETQGGMFTKAHKYIRGSSPVQSTKKDIDTLKDYGVNVVIDLRSPFERKQGDNPFKDDKDISFYEINLFDSLKIDVEKQTTKDYKDLGGLYIYMLETKKEEFKKIFNIFLNHMYDCILFHCTSGKDRTGVLSMLLMDLAGCHEYDIVKDYSETYENNKEINDYLLTLIEDEEAKEFIKSSPRYAMEFIYYLRENYGSAKEYLIHIGIEEDDVEMLKENFTL